MKLDVTIWGKGGESIFELEVADGDDMAEALEGLAYDLRHGELMDTLQAQDAARARLCAVWDCGRALSDDGTCTFCDSPEGLYGQVLELFDDDRQEWRWADVVAELTDWQSMDVKRALRVLTERGTLIMDKYFVLRRST